jgi:periplasmic copper chaperone A
VIALLLALLPALLLVLLLLRDVYPGSGLIERVARGLRAPRASADRPSWPVLTAGWRRRPGELFSNGLAGRAPPATAGTVLRRPRHGKRTLTRRRNTMYRKITIATLALGLVAPAVAQGHVTVQPDEVPAAGFTRLDVRVPNERDDAGTVKVEVKFPDGFHFASYEPVPGWTVDVKMEKLPEPVEGSHGEEITEQVDTITWTGDGREGIVPPGAFQDFGLSVQTPDAPDETLTFPSIQTYEGGEVVRWIEAPDAEEPAPTVALTAAEEEHGTAAEEEPEDEASSPSDEDDGTGDGLAVAALIVAGLGLGAGGTALARSRRAA